MEYQARRRELRAANAGEDEMNALFRHTKEFTDALFERSGQKGVVGAFEGGNYQAEGIYRPEQDCLMFTRAEQFCVVCAEAIGTVIDEYTLPGSGRLGVHVTGPPGDPGSSATTENRGIMVVVDIGEHE